MIVLNKVNLVKTMCFSVVLILEWGVIAECVHKRCQWWTFLALLAGTFAVGYGAAKLAQYIWPIWSIKPPPAYKSRHPSSQVDED